MKIFGEHEQKVIDQLSRCVNQEEGSLGVLCADGHFGYSAPIGGVIGYRDHISPAAVGFDLSCGNQAVCTNLILNDIQDDISEIMDRVYAEVSFGVGRSDGSSADHSVIDYIRTNGVDVQQNLVDTAAKQLGTVGAGNHYVDIFVDEVDRIWVGVHFGSRGFGHKTATHYLNLAARENGHEYREGGGEMEAAPDLLSVTNDAGQEYLQALEVAGRYAYAGREVVVRQVMDMLGARSILEEIHNHHNYAWQEEHNGENLWVVRKGATPAFPGQKGFVGASMGESAVILEGVDGQTSKEALYSTVHGAGRAMSRTAAAGKTRKRWACTNRDCDWVQGPGTHKPEDGRCPKCRHNKISKRWVHETKGIIDWDATTADLRTKGIELRGANAEEAPGAYKRLDEVLAYHEGTVRILHRLRPIGVAMASGEIVDPYKD